MKFIRSVFPASLLLLCLPGIAQTSKGNQPKADPFASIARPIQSQGKDWTIEQLENYSKYGTVPDPSTGAEPLNRYEAAEADNLRLQDEAIYWDDQYDLVEGQLHERHREFINMGIAGGISLASMLILWRTLVWLIRWLRKKPMAIMENKQLTALLLIATWCSVCFLIQALNPDAMRHPINAVLTAFCFAVPGMLFGGIAAWWYSPWRNRPRPGQVKTLFQEA